MQVVDHVAQSQYALQLLLPQADYAAALDIIADIQVSTIMPLHCCANAWGTYVMLEADAHICFHASCIGQACTCKTMIAFIHHVPTAWSKSQVYAPLVSGRCHVYSCWCEGK